MRFGICVVTLVSCLAVPGLYAETVVFDNSPPNQLNGNEMTQWIQAEDIPLTTAIAFDRIRFWSLEGTGTSYAGSIDWFVYADNGGQPDIVLYSGNAAAVARTFLGTAIGLSEYANLFVTGPISLPVGNYWLGLHNGPVAASAAADFYWETADSNATLTGLEFDLADPLATWVDTFQEHAFQLATPEPGSLGLLLLGLGSGLLAVRARRKAR